MKTQLLWTTKLLLVVIGCAGCGATVDPDNPVSLDSHTQMLRALDAIRKQDPYLKLTYGDTSIDNDEEQLRLIPEILFDKRVVQLNRTGRRRLWSGDNLKAITHFEEVRSLLEKYDGDSADVEENLFRLGVAYLRLGETENCICSNNGESCLFPIRDAGIHTDQTGSRQAINFFQILLQRNPEHLSAKWLLNIAYMTIGEYPDNVPPQLLLAPQKLSVDSGFPRFRNVASEVGLNTLSLSGGCIVDDFDGDNDFDVIVSSWGTGDQLRYFRNVDGRFIDESIAANFAGLYGGLNLIHADYDNDDDLDVLVLRGAWLSEAGRMPNSLLQNDGTGHFRDVTFECGIGGSHHPTQTAAWADIDNDGDLDLFVGNETDPSQLFENDGHGHFRDIATEAGVTNDGYTKGAAFGDFNADRYPDLYVSNQGGENRLYRNNKNGTFTDVAAQLNVTQPAMSFAVWFWDYNQDGVLDIFAPSYSYGPNYVGNTFFDEPRQAEYDCLYQGDGAGGFTESSQNAKLTQLTQPMGSNWGDLDNDGFPDFNLATGYPEFEGLMPNLMYWNRGGKFFTNVTTEGGFGHLQKGHAVSFADFDGDGDLDVFNQMGGAFPADKAVDCLYQNPGFGNSWLEIRLTGLRSNRYAIGARIKAIVEDDGTERTVYQWVSTGSSFGANPYRQHIGLGKATRIRKLEIYWPTSDSTQVFLDVPANQFIETTEGERDFRVVKM